MPFLLIFTQLDSTGCTFLRCFEFTPPNSWILCLCTTFRICSIVSVSPITEIFHPPQCGARGWSRRASPQASNSFTLASFRYAAAWIWLNILPRNFLSPTTHQILVWYLYIYIYLYMYIEIYSNYTKATALVETRTSTILHQYLDLNPSYIFTEFIKIYKL